MRPIVYFTIEPQNNLEHPDDSPVESEEISVVESQNNLSLGSLNTSVMEPQGKFVMEPQGKFVVEPQGKFVVEPQGKSVVEPQDKSAVKPEVNSTPENVDDIEHWRTVPVEIWKMIFNKMDATNSEMAKLRHVHRTWRDVIDQHVDFEVNLIDEKVRGKSMAHVRVKQCTVSGWMILPPGEKLFRDPALLTKIYLCGEVSRANFNLLAQQSPNLQYLRLHASLLHDDALFVGGNPAENNIIANFWNRIKEIDFHHDHMITDSSDEWSRNFTHFMTIVLPNLRAISFNSQFANTHDLLGHFLLQNPSVKYVDMGDQNVSFLPTNLQMPPVLSAGDFRHIQLSTIKMNVTSVSEVHRQFLLYLLNAQQSLVNLQITQFTWNYFMDGNCLHFCELYQVIQNNRSTLTSVNLQDLFLFETFDAKCFEKVSGLKTLVLQKKVAEEYSGLDLHIKNLGTLPPDLEKLELRNMNCDEKDLFKMVNRLQKLKCLKLLCPTENFLSPDLLEGLLQKDMLHTLEIGPIALKNLRVGVKGDRKYILLGNAGYILPVSKKAIQRIEECKYELIFLEIACKAFNKNGPNRDH